MQIAGMQKNSTIDFPGVLAAVLFTPGCNYRCFYCHNRVLLDDVPCMESAAVEAFLKKRAGMLDGIVISGGEPTLQADLFRFVAEVRALGYKVKLDTNGSNPHVVEKLLQDRLLDYVAVDYKAPFPRYAELCGKDASGVRETVENLQRSGIDWEMRTTLVPQIGKKELWEMAAGVPMLPKYALQLYRMQAGDTRFLKGLVPYTPLQVQALAEGIREIQPNVTTRC